MPARRIPRLGALLALLALAACARAPQSAADPESALVQRARAIHERVIALDTHDDIDPRNFTPERNYTQRLETQVNIPKMIEGGLDASFFIVYVGQRPDFSPEGYRRAYDQAMAKFHAIHWLADTLAPDRIGLAYTAADVRRIAAAGRKVALIGVENAYPLGEDLSNIRRFYDLGGRYLSLAHNGHSQWSDSNTGEREGWKWNGLSPLGKQAIAEMNRVGMMIDVSHPSKESMMQAIALSRAPVIASHSAIRALCDVSRNMDDEQLLALGKNGGVVQVVGFDGYIRKRAPDSPERAAAIAELRKTMGFGQGGAGRGAGLSEQQRAEYQRRMKEVDAKYPPPPSATVKDFVDHIDYAVKLIGIDHVGISSDFDGGGGVDGWRDASQTFNVTLELVRRGYTEEQIAKLWSGNLLRVMDEVQRVARELQGTRS